MVANMLRQTIALLPDKEILVRFVVEREYGLQGAATITEKRAR